MQQDLLREPDEGLVGNIFIEYYSLLQKLLFYKVKGRHI